VHLFSRQNRFRAAPDLLALAIFVLVSLLVLLCLLVMVVLLADALLSPMPWDPLLEAVLSPPSAGSSHWS
jgi:hypothetical protein